MGKVIKFDPFSGKGVRITLRRATKKETEYFVFNGKELVPPKPGTIICSIEAEEGTSISEEFIEDLLALVERY